MDDLYREFFDYYDESSIRGIKTVLGTFVSHNIEWFKDGELISVDEVNNLDRMKLAEAFINKRTYNGKYDFGTWYNKIRDFEDYELMNDVAQFIDLKIPQHYFVRIYEKEKGERVDRTYVRAEYKGIDSIDALEFLYTDNYILEESRYIYTKNEMQY
ncbi:hypothetical protein NNC19_18075 [Clostridium sp. SHJSY1]|uniref:hypothetical protein n=1 Tax=Clostridium sp. SHJSY1 TaxID=2942483 RepID=UPI002876A2E5|nr:hypothetical protein [Clostridium sp. SHJSY1]MDS0527601.1 hypothetical protein [Clostridium sp. SHJSY1]